MDTVKDNIDKIKKEGERIKDEVRERVSGYVATAFGLVAGLAWNDAIKSLIEYFFPASRDTLMAKFLYALLVTMAVVLITIYFIKIINKSKK